LLNPYR